VNNLGIKELIGRGTSRFSGSIPSRVFNVSLASSRINGVLVAPNETFSFASAIGDISKYTGYKEAYIIQNGKTILGDGGGVCQVSTTLFRAVMNAGLPIIERHAHAYRVGYYEQDSGPGLDATVFVPSVDFKFLNDTGNYILIQTSVNTKNLTADFKIYGTSDGRKSTVSKPVVTDQIAPADDLYVDEPTLPMGKIVQLEHRAWGARVSFSYTVEKGGTQIYQKNFVSVYQPWQAVYQRGVGPS
jgi:vancomycin resistance protein YoaR